MGKTKKGKILLSVLLYLGLGLAALFTLIFADVFKTVSLGLERKGHTATLLQDGRVLVAGGENAAGALAGAEIYDPAQEAFLPEMASALGGARTGHTAILLPDGRVFVMGGTNGVPLKSTEFYVPQSNAWVSGPDMVHARVGQTATVLADGRILVVGGDTEGTVEVYDPAAGGFLELSDSGGPVVMGQARSFHSAVVLKTGQVLIVGGLGLQGAALDSAEIFDGARVYAEEHHLVSPRVRPELRVLPDGKVQVIGGNDGVAAGTMEMFDPETGIFGAQAHVLNTSNGLNEVTGAGTRAAVINLSIADAALNRGGYTITEMPALGKALVVGGANADGVVLKSALVMNSSGATVTTSVLDFPAYSFVVMSGSGWAAGEMVELRVHQEQALSPDRTVYATVDELGNFLNTDLELDDTDIGATDIVTAKGTGSAYVAQTAFADAAPFKITFATDGLPVGIQVVVTFSRVNNGGHDNNNSTSFTTPYTSQVTADPGSEFTFAYPSPVGAGGAYVLDSVSPSSPYTTGASGNSKTIVATYKSACVSPSISEQPSDATVDFGQGLSISVSASGTAPLSYQWKKGGIVIQGAVGATYSIDSTIVADSGSYTVVVSNSCGSATSSAVILTVRKATPTITWTNPADITYGTPLSDAQLNATATTPGKFAYTPALGTILKAGLSQTLHVDFAPDDTANYNIASIDVMIDVSQKGASVTPTAAAKTYGDDDPALTGALAGFLADDGVAATYSRTPGETVAGGPYTISATLSPAGVLSNYNITYNTASFTITPKPASVTPNAGTKVYGNADPALTGTLVGFLSGDNVTAVYSRTPGETVLGGPYTISATLSPAGVLSNYNITYNTTSFTITPKPASVTPNAGTKVYGDADPSLTGTLEGFLAGDNVTAAYSRTLGETVLGGPYTISATLSPENVLSNYTITYGTAKFTITPRPASVTPSALGKIYGDPDPVLTGSLNGFLASDNVTATYSRIAGEAVMGGPYTISAVLSPTGVLSNYGITYNTALFTISPRPITVTADPKTKILNAPDPALTYKVTGTLIGNDAFSGALTRVPGEAVGPYDILQGTLALSTNYTLNYVGAKLSIIYGSGPCNGSPGRQILQPINPDGTSVFKQKSTVPAKFRVFDANCNSIGTPGVVSSFRLVQINSGILTDVDEIVDSTTPDTAFRWSPTDQLWIFNINTKNLKPGYTYYYLVTLNDGTTIPFSFGLK